MMSIFSWMATRRGATRYSTIPYVSWFGTASMVVSAEQAGYHTMTVKYIERQDTHYGIEITLNGEHLQNAQVPINIKPGSCPNPLNVKNKGVLPVAILGMEEFDVPMIDVASIRLEGVAPMVLLQMYARRKHYATKAPYTQ
jgi:hypothetical protein